jgi:dihydrodipicolinate synthase/N-acetylneuraminate lyase
MAVPYAKDGAKAHAQAHWKGCCDVILPSFSHDLKRLNEAGIRHDVRRNIENGFWGALLVSECATSLDEYISFMEIAVDEARGRHKFLIHGTFDNVDDLNRVIEAGERIGMEGLLLGHPNSFYPKSEDALYDYLAGISKSTNLAVALFVTVQMNLSRLHTSGYPLSVIKRLAAHQNVVAVKYEVGRPGIAGDYECWKALKGTGTLFSDPLEAHAPLTVEQFGMQFMGTSNYEYWGPAIPQIFTLLTEGRFEEAMEQYWRINPARQARVQAQATFAGANFIHRYLWKYQAWLQGYNGGPMRQPIMKLNDSQMRLVRDGLVRSGFEVPPDDPAAFYEGRNPC